MSKFVLEIDIDNAAFHDDGDTEIANILIQAADGMASGLRNTKLRDVNGNTVGEYKIIED